MITWQSTAAPFPLMMFKVISFSLLLACSLGLLAGCGKGSDQVSETVAQPSVVPQFEGKMERLLEEVRDAAGDNNRFLGDRSIRLFQQRLERLQNGQTPNLADVFQTRMDLGIALLRNGREEEARKQLTECYQIAHKAKGVPPSLKIQAAYELGVAFLRLGETENCCKQHDANSCILPLQSTGLHTAQTGSATAFRLFREVVTNTPTNTRQHVAAKWLMNIAAMTLGTFPDAIPAPQQAKLARVGDTDKQFPKFPNIAPTSGLATFGLAGGALVDDFNGDGYLDIMTSSWDSSVAMLLFLNEQDGTFRRCQEEAGLDKQLGGLNLIQADYDNDGDLDVYVLRGAWLGQSGAHPNSLLRNEGVGPDGVPRFRDVTFACGLAGSHHPTQTGGWADFDLDGDLDLFVGNETGMGHASPCQLFRNEGVQANGDVTFIEIAKEAGVTNDRWTKGVTWGDFDNDRYPDLYLSNMEGINRLYRNLGDGTFEDVSGQAGVGGPDWSFPTWSWDYDNDGALDIFASFYSPEAGEANAYYFGYKTPDNKLPGIYKNDGKGGFGNAARAARVDLPMMPMGCNYGDINNDGWLDFYLGTGNIGIEQVTPNLMFINREGKHFDNVTLNGGFGHLQKGHGISLADLDHDGDLDIFAQMGGAFPVDRFYDALFENPGFENHWLSVTLEGTESARSAIGCRIKATFEEGGKSRSIYHTVNSGGSFGSNPLRQHLGLGQASKVSQLEVFWPKTGKTQVFKDIAADQWLRIRENASEVEVMTYKSFKIGA